MFTYKLVGEQLARIVDIENRKLNVSITPGKFGKPPNINRYDSPLSILIFIAFIFNFPFGRFFSLHNFHVYSIFQNVSAIRIDIVYCSNDNIVCLACFLLRATIPLFTNQRQKIGECLALALPPFGKCHHNGSSHIIMIEKQIKMF